MRIPERVHYAYKLRVVVAMAMEWNIAFRQDRSEPALLPIMPEARFHIAVVNGVRDWVVPVAILRGRRKVRTRLDFHLNPRDSVNDFRLPGFEIGINLQPHDVIGNDVHSANLGAVEDVEDFGLRNNFPEIGIPRKLAKQLRQHPFDRSVVPVEFPLRPDNVVCG